MQESSERFNISSLHDDDKAVFKHLLTLRNILLEDIFGVSISANKEQQLTLANLEFLILQLKKLQNDSLTEEEAYRIQQCIIMMDVITKAVREDHWGYAKARILQYHSFLEKWLRENTNTRLGSLLTECELQLSKLNDTLYYQTVLPAEIIYHIGRFLSVVDFSYFSMTCAFFKDSLQSKLEKRKKARLVQIGVGRHHMMVLKGDGSVWAYGQNNKSGQLGCGEETVVKDECIRVKGIPAIKEIAVKENNNYFLDEDGTVWVCGENDFGQLGLGHTNVQLTPTRLNELFDIEHLAAEGLYALFAQKNGTVWGCGHVPCIQVPRKAQERLKPFKVTELSNIKQIGAGSSHVLLLLKDGTVYGFGNNQHGQLGLGYSSQEQLTLTQLQGLYNIKKIEVRSMYTSFFKDDGTVLKCGRAPWGNWSTEDAYFRQIP